MTDRLLLFGVDSLEDLGDPVVPMKLMVTCVVIGTYELLVDDAHKLRTLLTCLTEAF